MKRDGTVTRSVEEVVEELLAYYQGLLGTDVDVVDIDMDVFQHGPGIPSDCLEALVRGVTDVEIKQAIFDIGNDKAPGPDGYTSGFFKKTWDIVGFDVCQAVKEFFVSGQLLKQLNHTIIALP